MIFVISNHPEKIKSCKLFKVYMKGVVSGTYGDIYMVISSSKESVRKKFDDAYVADLPCRPKFIGQPLPYHEFSIREGGELHKKCLTRYRILELYSEGIVAVWSKALDMWVSR